MSQNQNETTEFGIADCGMRTANSRDLTDRRRDAAFTLVELLVVISIIAVLAGLITGAVINALNRAKQASITLEIQQLNTAIEDLKNEYGSYPPNVFPIFDSTLSLSNVEKKTAANDLIRFMRKAFSRSSEFQIDMTGTTPKRNTNQRVDNLYPLVSRGISPSEALVFWLGGFSQDVTRPLTGTDLTGSSTSGIVTIDSRKPRYEFDRGRLRATNTVNLLYANGNTATIQLYEYLAPGSEEPYIYFDTSRRTPLQNRTVFTHNPDPTTIPGHEFFYKPASGGGCIVPLKKRRLDAPPNPTLLNQIEYVNARKFQILHCGIDDAWGNLCYDVNSGITLSQLNNDNFPNLLFPDGPFVGDLADTVGNFGTGTLEDEQP